MKKTKIEQRIKNAVNAFLDNEQESFGEDNLSFVSGSAMLKQETAEGFNKKGEVLIKMLKRAFIFLPGAFYLFFGTISVCFFEFFRENPWSILMAFLVGSFMTIFGIGNIKNLKHLVIPLSIVAVGIMAFSLFSIFGNIKYIFEFGIYFFPLALVAPFLAKHLVDKTDEIKI